MWCIVRCVCAWCYEVRCGVVCCEVCVCGVMRCGVVCCEVCVCVVHCNTTQMLRHRGALRIC